MTPHSYYDIAIEGNRKSRFIIIVPYKIFLTFVLELDLSLMDFMKNVQNQQRNSYGNDSKA